MKLETTFLHSKIARRTFWLFVVCALLPITVLAVISLRNVTAQLREQNLRELHQVSREEAISIFGRLSFLEANLRLVALGVGGAPGKTSQTFSGDANGPYSELASRFGGLELVTPNGIRRILYGKKLPSIDYTATEQRFLHSGRSILSTKACDELDPCILLSRIVSLDDPERGILVGEIRPAYLWDTENSREPMSICVLDPEGWQLFCTGEPPKRFPREVTENFSGQFQWQGSEHEYSASYWNLPLQNSFFSKHWTIVSSEANPDIVAPLIRFRASFLLVLLLALWVVLLLSLIQIRRNLHPLSKLKEGTRRISRGDFQTRVEIKSGDEFEELAGSFNSMAGRIERQLKALKVINEIDRAVLSAWELPRIVETVCARLREVLPHALVSVSLFDAKGSPTVVTHVFKPGSDSPEHTATVDLTSEEMAELKSQRRVYILADNRKQARHLEPLRARGMAHFLTVPVVLERGQSAIFTLGHGKAAVWTEEDLEEARHLADQIAVAFSNSQLVTDLEQLQWGILTALAHAIDAKSPWTLGHSERVTTFAVRIAQAMGLPPRELDIMRRGGLVHDIGKIGVSAEILDKPGKLTDEEMRKMRDHVNIGLRILQPIPVLAESMPIVAQHHEWLNGDGYPNGLAGEEITLHARIFAVADCFDALISDRPYRAGMPIEGVIQMIQEGAGKQFDPNVVKVFRTIVMEARSLEKGEEPTGHLVGVS
jgi:putative nucleotidyltransferase with HDIG domain